MSNIDDIVEALGDTETGKTFRELIEKSNFLETEFNFPGAKKSVTGQEILQHVKGIEVSEGIGSIAAYDVASGKMHFDPTLVKKMAPVLEQSGIAPEVAAKYLREQFSFTAIHELGHAGADLVGIDGIEKRANGQNLGKQMPDSVAKHIGEQEKIADSFAQEVFKSAGQDHSQYSYLTAAESTTYAQRAALGRELTVDESLQIEDFLRQNNIDPKSRLQLASYLEGDMQSEKLKLMSDSYSYGEGVKIKTESLGENPVVETIRKAQPKKSEPVLKVGKPVESPAATAEKVTQTGNATPKSATKGSNRVFVAGQKASSTAESTQGKVVAEIIDDTIKKVASTGAPVKEVSKLRGMADMASKAVAKGTKNAGNLKMLGLAAAVGIGAVGASQFKRTQQDNINRRLLMQRRGIIK